MSRAILANEENAVQLRSKEELARAVETGRLWAIWVLVALSLALLIWVLLGFPVSVSFLGSAAN